MAGLGFALAGAASGIGDTLVQRAEQKRQRALMQMKRKWQKEDAATAREQELADMKRQRQWQLDDRQQQREWALADEQRQVDRRNARIDERASVYESLFGTESGGDFGADNGEGYTGRVQAGQERLDDFSSALGIGRVTPQQFKQDPGLQEDFERWHFSDINSFIDKNGLDKYEGQEVGGTPISRSGIVAMAHLGGKDGARRFLETGGEYNPADSNGTSLSDYAHTHGGRSTDMSEVYRVMADPETPAAMRNAVAGQLGGFGQSGQGGPSVEGATDDVTEYNVARNEGYEGSFADWQGKGQSDDNRRIVEGADGRKYYADTREPVLPGVEAPSEESAKERQIARIEDVYDVDRRTAVGIVDGVVTVEQDNVTGETVFRNVATQEVNRPEGDEQPENRSAEEIDESMGRQAEEVSIDRDAARSALGGSGVITNIANIASDATGFGAAAPETQRAAEFMDNLATRTVQTLSGEWPGKPSNYTREMIEGLTVRPSRLTIGLSRARDKIDNMLREVNRSVMNADRVARGNGGDYTPEQRAQAQETLDDMITLHRDYKTMRNLLSAEAENGSQQSQDDLPHPTTQEEYDSIPSGGHYMHPDTGKRTIKQ